MKDCKEDVINQLFDIGAVKFGNYKLKSGIWSPVYFDLRVIIAYPKLLQSVSKLLWALNESRESTLICGVPYTALPIATLISVDNDLPMIIRRKETKDYGTQKILEGVFQNGQECLIIEDCVSSGSSVLETVQVLEKEGLVVRTALVFVDRQQGGLKAIKDKGIQMKSVFTLREMLDVLTENGRVNKEMFTKVESFLLEVQDICAVQTQSIPKHVAYKTRSSMCSNVVGSRLLNIMSEKRTNLCLAADVTQASRLLQLAEEVGPHICLLKTHVDILDNFTPELITQLRKAADRHNFLLFEDRKLADIGKTVSLQTSGGLYQLSSWCDLVTIHGLPGPGILAGIREALQYQTTPSRTMGCLIVAEMSSQGALTTDKYKEACGHMASDNPDLVVGFISQSRVLSDPKFIHCTPGVNLAATGDGIGQQYNSPEFVMSKGFCDIIIVGRGITEAENPAETAAKYKKIGFSAYEKFIEV